jgi:hypothetical protein
LGNIIDVSIFILGGVSKVGQVVKAMINLLFQGNFVSEVSPAIVFTISFIGRHVVFNTCMFDTIPIGPTF